MISINTLEIMFENHLPHADTSRDSELKNTIVLVTKRFKPDIQKIAAAQSNDILFISNSYEICAKLLDDFPESIALLLLDQTNTTLTGSEKNNRIFMIYSADNIMDIYYQVQSKSSEISSWITKMEQTILEGGSYQQVVNIGQELIPANIVVTNTDYRVIAFTDNIPQEDEVSRDLVWRGFYSQELMDERQARIKKNTASVWRNVQIIHRGPGDQFTECFYTLVSNGTYAGEVVLRTSIRKPTKYLIDMFLLLINHIVYCLENDALVVGKTSPEPSTLFAELIRKHPFTQTTLEQRLKRLPIKPKGTFQLIAIQFEHDPGDSYNEYCVRLLKKSFPGAHIGTYKDRVLILDANADIMKDRRSLQSFLSAQSGIAGVSMGFEKLLDLSFAYQQTDMAILFASENYATLETSFNESAAHAIYEFRDVIPRLAAETARNTNVLYSHCVQNGAVAKIHAWDKAHGTDDAKLLYTYLANDRRIAQTCAALYLHRSTFAYRLEKLVERFDLDLDNFRVRQTLLNEFLTYSDYDWDILDHQAKND